jgi:hypothetical protein
MDCSGHGGVIHLGTYNIVCLMDSAFLELRVSLNKRTCRLSIPCFGTAERARHQLRIIMRRGVAVTVQNCNMTFKLKETISIWATALLSMTSDSCGRCTRHVTRCWRFTLLVG